MKHPVWIVLMFWSSLGYTSQDTLLKYQYGELLGLPSEYQPASFDKNAIALRVGKKELIFPVCLKKYFTTNNSHRLVFKASWYHKLGRMPPYISIDIEFAAKDFAYSLLFDMNQLTLLQVEVRTSHANGLYLHDIDIGNNCSEEIRKNTRGNL